MSLVDVGAPAPPVPGVAFGDGPRLVVFYKVTCPVCQMAAPKVATFEEAFPGRVIGVGQDPVQELEAYGREFGAPGVPFVPDLEPWDVSNAYGIDVVPTFVLVDGHGLVADTVVAWEREGVNRLAERLATLAGVAPVVISEPDDGLPPFRPG